MTSEDGACPNCGGQDLLDQGEHDGVMYVGCGDCDTDLVRVDGRVIRVEDAK